MTCGIYTIQNLVNGKIYIGQAVDIEKRWKTHKSELRYKSHTNKHLQNAWNYYKEDKFEFTIICECDENQLNTLEQYYIFELMSYDGEVGYNKEYGGKSGRPTEETKAKLNELRKSGKIGMSGKHHKEETKELLRKIHNSPEMKERARYRTKKLWENEDYKNSITEAVKKRWEDTIYREKITINSKNNWNDPKYREIQDMYHNKYSKTYVQTTLDNKLIKIWKSSKDLITNLNIKSRGFWGCLSNQQASTGNYKFYYLEEYIDKFGSIHTAIDDNEYSKTMEIAQQQKKDISLQMKEIYLQKKLKRDFTKRLNEEIEPYINISKEVHSYMSQFNSYIVCLTHNKIFDSIESANNFYNINLTSNSIHSKRGQSFSGVYNSEPLVWEYFKDYVKMSKSEIDSLVLDAKQKMSHYYGSTSKPIVCVEKDCAYISLGYVERLGIASRSGIRKCLQGIQRTAGGYHWEYYYGGNPQYDEMIKNQEKELKDRMRGGKKNENMGNTKTRKSRKEVCRRLVSKCI